MDDIQMVPFAAYEAQAERNVRTVKHMSIGWCISVIMLVAALIISMSYDQEMTETTTGVEQAGDNGATNSFIGGDYYDGNAESSSND